MMQETPQFATMPMPMGAMGGQHQQLVYVFNPEAGQWQPMLTTANEPVFYVVPEDHATPSSSVAQETISEMQPFLMEDDEDRGTTNKHKVFTPGNRPHKDTLLWLSCTTAAFGLGLLGALIMFAYSCDRKAHLINNGPFALAMAFHFLGCVGCFVASRKAFRIAERCLAWSCFVFGSMQIVLWMMSFFFTTQECSFNSTPDYF